MRRTGVSWSEVLRGARKAPSRQRPATSREEDLDLEPLLPREALQDRARDALRSAYQGLDGLVIDLDDDDLDDDA